MPFLACDECDIYYEVEGAGPAIVFAHGLGGNHMSWWQQVPFLAADHTCVVFAHRGFNPSRADADVPDPAKFVEDLQALISHLGIENVALVGQSMGGWAALAYALRYPANVRALVMAATVGGLDHPELDRIRAGAAKSGRVAQLRERGIHPACGERMANEQPAKHQLYHQVSRLSTNLDKEALRSRLRGLKDASPEEVARLEVPTLCIVGEEDVVLPPAAVELLASLIPHARLEEVPRTGHSVYWERPELFNTLVSEFAAEL